jgi:urea transport system permease protein
VGVEPSISMVIAAAVGGRTSLLGAVYGSLIVNYGKTFFSERFPELWLFLIGALFIAVVMVFPDGLAGIQFGELWGRARKLFPGGRGVARVTPSEDAEPVAASGGVGGGVS